ncbi:unnamed protein product [Knipowitschia caucasica]
MASECDVASEIEVLQSIYLDELQVDRTQDGQWEVRLVLHPSTAEDAVSQFVRLTLTLTLDKSYPLSSPSISIHNPRGLSDDKILSVQRCLQDQAQASVGSPVLYQLIEKAKEILTESNIPHGNCVICLYDFKEGETLTKTLCYHYFHSHCLGRYIRHSEQELQQRQKEMEEDKTRDAHTQELSVVCPVCREPLDYDVSHLLSCPAPLLPEVNEALMTSEFQLKWNELQRILDKQRNKGGIIDPEEESNRFLIHIQTPAATDASHLDSPPDVPPPLSTEPSPACPPSMHQCSPACPPSMHQSNSRGWRRGRPITEQLDTLSLSRPPHSRILSSKEDSRPPEATMEAPRSASERGYRGRRRGPQRHSQTRHHHWDSRGAHSQCYRGPKNQRRGPHRPPVEQDRTREEVL